MPRVVEVVSAEIRENHIKDVLASMEISQQEAARRLGMSYRHFNRIVLGDASPTYVTAKKMEVVFGQPASKLFRVHVATRRT